jgi:hypothetical protein
MGTWHEFHLRPASKGAVGARTGQRIAIMPRQQEFMLELSNHQAAPGSEIFLLRLISSAERARERSRRRMHPDHTRTHTRTQANSSALRRRAGRPLRAGETHLPWFEIDG